MIMTTRMTTARSTTEVTNDKHAHITTHSWPWTGGEQREGGTRTEGRKAEWYKKGGTSEYCVRGDERGERERESDSKVGDYTAKHAKVNAAQWEYLVGE